MPEPPAPPVSLGHYRIVSPLGAGGMGEVYLAMDTRLSRNVAIKILPASSTADAEAQQRMLREARHTAVEQRFDAIRDQQSFRELLARYGLQA